MRKFRLFFAALIAGLLSAQGMSAQTIWTGSSVTAAVKKTVYIHSVGADIFIGKGGRWGTEAVGTTVGMPFYLAQSGNYYTLRTEMSLQDGAGATSYLTFMDGKISVHDSLNFVLDQYDQTGNLSKYTFTAVSGATNQYYIKVSTNTESAITKGTYYLYADTENHKLIGKQSTTTPTDDKYKWIIVTEDERKEKFQSTEASSSSAVPATFLMNDQNFGRRDQTINSWETKDTKSSSTWTKASNSSDKDVLPLTANTFSSTTTTYTYKLTGHCDGYNPYDNQYYGAHDVTQTFTSTKPYDELTDAEKTKNITCTETYKWNNNHSSPHNQTVTLKVDNSKTTSSTGTTNYSVPAQTSQFYFGNGHKDTDVTFDYEVPEVVTGQNLQRIYGGKNTGNIKGSYGAVRQTVASDKMIRKGWYRVSCVAFTTNTNADGKSVLFVSAGTNGSNGGDSDSYKEVSIKAISGDDIPETYVKAYDMIHTGVAYQVSAMVYVGEKNGSLETLSFGVYTDGANADAWTCFGDFNISYYGDPTLEIILDEDQTDVKYINDQKNNTDLNDKNCTLYLHRTMNAGKWNSIVLPVSLTVGQVTAAFGDGTKISEYKGTTDESHPNRIYFSDVILDRSQENDIAMKAGTLYIIKPVTAQPTAQEEKTFSAISGTTFSDYYKILQVAFPTGAADYTARIEEEEHQATAGNSEKVKFCGTYVKVTGTDAIPANSYVLNGNNQGGTAGLWYFRTVTTNTKGFRGWLQQTQSGEQKVSFVINGISDDATAIDGITADETTAARHQGVYNLNGQRVSDANSLEGLARGIYIMGGKKYVVK